MAESRTDMRHLTHIVEVPYGVNILGLLELFAWIGALAGMIALNEFVPRPLRLIGIGGELGGIAVFDLWWRIRQPESSRWRRLVSPYLGGCFLFLPIWLIFSVGLIVGATALSIAELT